MAQVGVNSLLTSPATPMVNARQPPTSGSRRGQMGEATAQMFGVVQGIRDAFSCWREVLARSASSLFRGNASDAAQGLRDNADEFRGVYKAAADTWASDDLRRVG